MSNFRHYVVTTGFIMMFVGLIIYSDSEVWNSGYTPFEMNLPDEFVALNMIGTETGLNKTITEDTDTKYDFKDELNITNNRYGIRWGFTGNWIELWELKKFFGNTYFSERIMVWNKDDLINAWDSDNNASIIKVNILYKTITIIFEDTNRTRHNIADSYDDGTMYCTMIIPDRTNLDDGYFSARDIVFALLTFRLPDILADIHPLLSHMISLIIYIQLSYLFFMLLTTLLHGGA
ncbi:hypothetical protein ES702_01467 [subsurface metagenome]